MCGVAGLLVAGRRDEHDLLAVARRMTDSIAHRGPDGEAAWSDMSNGIVLGHRRLAILDVGPTGSQPMTSASGRWVISYNGEIYNHPLLRRQLKDDGISFRGTSDTETLLAALDRWGVDDALARVDGMFAFAAWDRDERRLFLARDRLGEKPMYWSSDGRRLAFGSELNALAGMRDFDHSLDAGAARSVLRFGFVRPPATIYRNAAQLEPGHLLEARVVGGRVSTEIRMWWSLGDVVGAGHIERQQRETPHDQASLDSAVTELGDLMSASVATRLLSDVPLGAFLSGGIDSSLVAALAQRALGGQRLSTFTVKMPDAGLDESETAERVANHLGTDHTTVELPLAEVLDVVPTLAHVWDEPFADPSMLPSLMLCRAARRELTVCLAGDGGDELFAGYNRHALGDAITRRTTAIPRPVRSGVATAMTALKPSTIDRAGRTLSPLLPKRWQLPALGDKVHKGAALLRGDGGDVWTSLATVWPIEDDSVLPPAPVPDLSTVESMMWLDTAVVLPDDMLVKLDRASMAASLEVRLPFLSPDVLAWSWRQPMGFKTTRGVGKVVVRRLLEQLVPIGIHDLPKRGFDPPLGTWLRGPLRGWASDLLAAPLTVENGWIDGKDLAETWRSHLDGSHNWEYRLWSVLMLESWLRR